MVTIESFLVEIDQVPWFANANPRSTAAPGRVVVGHLPAPHANGAGATDHTVGRGHIERCPSAIAEERYDKGSHIGLQPFPE
jgi:hypothetical protein